MNRFLSFMKRNKFLTGLSFFAFVATVAYAAGFYRITQDKLILGTGTSASKTIEFDLGLSTANPKFRANSTAPFLEFSQDGTNFAAVGSGTGSGSAGVNVVSENGGFEASPSTKNWTNSGSGTFTVTSTAANVCEGSNAGAWNPAANNDTLTYAAQDVPNKIGGTLCIAEMYYKGGDALTKLQVVDGTNTPLQYNGGNAEVTLDTNSAQNCKRAYVHFACPNDGATQIKPRLIASGDGAAIYVDSFHVGTKDITRGAVGGWKVYDTEVTYSSTPSGWSLNKHSYIPYKDPYTGKWRLRFNINAAVTSTLSASFTVNGVTFENSGIQVVTALGNTSSTVGRAYVSGNTGTINFDRETSGTAVYISGDVALESKPTWANEDGTVSVLSNRDIYATAKFVASGLSVSPSIPDNTETQITVWNNDSSLILNGGSFNGTSYTVPVTGEYEVGANVEWGSSSITTTKPQILIKKNGTTTIASAVSLNYSSAFYPMMSTRRVLKLTEGDQISVYVYQDSAALSFSLSAGGASTNFYVVRVPDRTMEAPTGFPVQATPTNTGFITEGSQTLGGQKTFNNLVTAPLSGKMSASILTAGTYNALNVTDISTITVDDSGGNIVVNGLTGGVTGQIIWFLKPGGTANTVTLTHASPSATDQNLRITGNTSLVMGGATTGAVGFVYTGQNNRWVSFYF